MSYDLRRNLLYRNIREIHLAPLRKSITQKQTDFVKKYIYH